MVDTNIAFDDQSDISTESLIQMNKMFTASYFYSAFDPQSPCGAVVG
jgi:hypothetical protein